MSKFLAMGGYAAFIWPAYAVAAVLLTGLLAVSWRSMRQREALVESLRASRRRETGEKREPAS
jgi:heme exporter protein D